MEAEHNLLLEQELRNSALAQAYDEEETIRFLTVVLSVVGVSFVLLLVAVLFGFFEIAPVTPTAARNSTMSPLPA
ncbi:hypothetical protein MTO96_033462 [Rhipicephalus appendiculatus]